MRMYLCSYGLAQPAALERLLGKPVSESTAVLFDNSKERRSSSERKDKATKSVQNWSAFRQIDIKDLREYEDVQSMKQDILSYDAVVFVGGETEALMVAMNDSGFSAIARDVAESVVYIGESAGAVVCAPNFGVLSFYTKAENKLLADDPTRGLNLVNFVTAAHEDSTDPRYKGRGAELAEENPDLAIVPLGDKQAVIINDQDLKIVGA